MPTAAGIVRRTFALFRPFFAPPFSAEVWAFRCRREDYSAAAVLRDMLRAAENADPVISAQRALEACIREERYEVRLQL
jgi:hypothetical protein